MQQPLQLLQPRWRMLLPARQKRPLLQPMPLGGPQCCPHRRHRLLLLLLLSTTDCAVTLRAPWPMGSEHQWLAANGAAPRGSASGWVMHDRLAHREARAHGHRTMPARQFAGFQCMPWPRHQRRCDEWCQS